MVGTESTEKINNFIIINISGRSRDILTEGDEKMNCSTAAFFLLVGVASSRRNKSQLWVCDWFDVYVTPISNGSRRYENYCSERAQLVK